MNSIFYRPNLKPDRDYMSDAEFEENVDDITESDNGTEEDSGPAESLLKEIEEVYNMAEILPDNIKNTVQDNLTVLANEYVDYPIPQFDPEEPTDEGSKPKEIDIKKVSLPDDKFFKLPTADPVGVVVEKVGDLHSFMENSFKKDRTDMLKDYVNRLRLIIQQFMREVLYLTKDAGFVSYMDLFHNYITVEEDLKKLPKHLRHASDRVIRSQVSRDQKSRLFKKLYNIDRTIFHLRSNRASHELRQRYYASKSTAADSYTQTLENDELRRSRREYDKKYEKSMYNYYKYLNSSVVMTDEIIKTFLSEARGKATLKKNGIDIEAGYKAEEARGAAVTKRLEDETKKALSEGKKADREKKKMALKSGKSESYSGTYGDKKGSVSDSGSTTTGNAPVFTKWSESDLPNSTEANKNKAVVDYAIDYVKRRGEDSSNPIIYSMTQRLNPNYADCSEFIRRCFVGAKRSSPGGYTKDQVLNKNAEFVADLKDLQPGDLMFFKNKSDSVMRETHVATLPNGAKYDIHHVIMYIGGSRVAECTVSRGLCITDFKKVKYKKEYILKHFVGARRF